MGNLFVIALDMVFAWLITNAYVTLDFTARTVSIVYVKIAVILMECVLRVNAYVNLAGEARPVI